MKKMILIAIGLMAIIGLVGVGVAAAEGEVEVAGRGLHHGHILAINGVELTVETRQGILSLLTDENTRYRIPGVAEPGLDNLAVGDHIAVAGRRTEDGALLARLVVRIPARQEIGQLCGELTAKGDNWLEITRLDGTPITALVTDQTRYHIPGVAEPGLDDLSAGEPVFSRGLWNDAGELVAQLVGRVPDGVENTITGRVTAVNEPTIELLTRQGPALVITSENTLFRVPGVEQASLVDIQVNHTLTAGGIRQEDGLHAAVVAIHPERPQRAARRGVVSANDGATIALETPNGQITVHVTANTRIRVAGVENPTMADIQVGFQATVAGRLKADNSIEAWGIGARPAPAADRYASPTN